MCQPTSTKDDIAILRARHAFENEQMHKRLTWLGTFQSILFAALGVAWDGKQADPLVATIAGLGFVIALQGIFALYGVGMALINTQRAWFDQGLDKIDKYGLFGVFDGRRVPDYRVMPLPEMVIPTACSAAWALVLWMRFVHYFPVNVFVS